MIRWIIDRVLQQTKSAMTPLEKLDSLDRQKQNAWLAFFAGATGSLFCVRRGDTGEEIRPSFGKAECEWVEDWRDFWCRELVELGFLTFEETEPQPANGMVEGSVWWRINLFVTPEGRQAREDWWTRWRQQVDANKALQDD